MQQVVATALGGEPVRAHLVHQETTFDAQEVRRHVTVLVVTGTRLVVAHVDDHGPDDVSPTAYASASTEAVPLHAVRTVVLQHVVAEPMAHRAGTSPDELSLTVGWGSVQRLDLEPAGCSDPACEADHGYTGTMSRRRHRRAGLERRGGCRRRRRRALLRARAVARHRCGGRGPRAGVTSPSGDLAQAPTGTASLAEVLPAVARAMDLTVDGAVEPTWELPAANRVVVVLVDGLGDTLLARRASYAPYLTSLRAAGRGLAAGFPSTTATSMGTFGTGTLAGTHGLVGYQVLDPGTDRLLNELSWEDGPDPRVWQPRRTVFEQVAAQGVEVVQVGPGFFQGSGLTEAALRGARFVAAGTLDARVDAAAAAVRSAARTLVYVYWGDLDKVGHVDGCGSYAWCDELSAVDLAIRSLAARLPSDALLLVTADHGMVDIPDGARLDLAAGSALERSLAEGVRLTGGEPRAPMLYCEPGRVEAVLARWRAELPDFDVLSRDEAVAAGWFGPVGELAVPRIGDVVVASRGDRSVHDSRVQRTELLALIGMHGSRTADEVAIPLLVRPPGR